MRSQMSESQTIHFRSATIEDLPAVLLLLADDVLGTSRENLDEAALGKYQEAFRRICAQQGNQILLGVQGDEVVATLQLTIIPGLAHQGGTRAQIEAVRVKSSARSQGIGKLLFQEAVTISSQCGCSMVQLTTDRRRGDAVRFYESLGFESTHIGMKLPIPTSQRLLSGADPTG